MNNLSHLISVQDIIYVFFLDITFCSEHSIYPVNSGGLKIIQFYNRR